MDLGSSLLSFVAENSSQIGLSLPGDLEEEALVLIGFLFGSESDSSSVARLLTPSGALDANAKETVLKLL